MDSNNNQTTQTPNVPPEANTSSTPDTTNLIMFDDCNKPTEQGSRTKPHIVVLVAIISAVILLFSGFFIFKLLSNGERHPTLELAKSVCEKYGGELETTNSSTLFDSESYYCFNKKDNGIYLSNGASFSIGFIENDKKNSTWAKIRSTINDGESHEDISGYVILENSDNLIKAYASIAGLVRVYVVAYDNAVVEISAGRDSVVEEILSELGFPDGKRANDYK